MSNKPYKDFEPKWVKEPAPPDSYRSIFRWGDPEFVKYPKESLYKMMKEKVISVNSVHHQAIKELSESFVPMAFSFDGLILNSSFTSWA